MTLNRVRYIVAAALLGMLGAAAARAADTRDEYLSARAEIDTAFRTRLQELAAKCKELKLPEQARITASWFFPRDPHRQYLFLPLEADPHRSAPDAPRIVQQWYARFSAHRQEHAEALFQLAQRELAAKRPTRAYQLLHEVLYENPDHAAARSVLGYRRVNDRWRKPEGIVTGRLQRMPHRDLGLNAGEYWIVESGHFSVTVTSARGEEAGRQLAQQLEDLYAVWQQLFFQFWSNAGALARRFDTTTIVPRTLARRHKIVLFRDREQYVRALKKLEPQIELTIGFYMEPTRTAYFFGGEGVTADSMLHEATHQLFSETGTTVPAPGDKANAWVVEGVAMYLESLRRLEGYCTVGGLDADRLQFARYRTRNEGLYTPLQELVKLGRPALQKHQDIRRLYSQSAGLTALLMDYQHGSYRPALVEYLQTVYLGRDGLQSLASATGVPLTALDKQYLEFLNVKDADLAYLAAVPWAKRLSLGRTSVTDAGLQSLAGHTRLEWVDVAYTDVGDAGIANLQAAKGLRHLIAEHTALTDAALQTIGRFPQLEILDLSGTRISDAGLAGLSRSKQLSELFLAGTRITDAGLEHLRSLKRLKTLDVNKTGVTREGFLRLKQSLPALETEVR